GKPDPFYIGIIENYMEVLEICTDSIRQTYFGLDKDEVTENLLDSSHIFDPDLLARIYHSIGFVVVAFSNLNSVNQLGYRNVQSEYNKFLRICKILRGSYFSVGVEAFILSGEPLRNI